jgi:uncharacterized membrane protein YczE
MTIGTVSIAVGIVILVFVYLMKEKLGLGTIVNMVLIGLQIDFLLQANIIPQAEGFIVGIPMLVIGMLLIGVGSYFYMGAGFGAGPRDSLMVVLMRLTKKSAGFCRAAVECSVVLVGWLLGGMIGIGTVITAFGLGICVQIVFKLFKFDAKAVKHETLVDTYRLLFKS